MEMFLGFDIGGTKCAVVLGDANGEVYEKSVSKQQILKKLSKNCLRRAISL